LTESSLAKLIPHSVDRVKFS